MTKDPKHVELHTEPTKQELATQERFSEIEAVVDTLKLKLSNLEVYVKTIHPEQTKKGG